MTLIKKHWKYRLDGDFEIMLPVERTVYAEFEWATIDGRLLTIKDGYAWDGCTPKYIFLGLFSIGTPDGKRDKDGWSQTGKASIVHDVLCQYRHELPYTKNEVTEVFRFLLERSGWPLTRVYCAAVDRFGPQDFGATACTTGK